MVELYFRYAAPPSDDIRFRSVFPTLKCAFHQKLQITQFQRCVKAIMMGVMTLRKSKNHCLSQIRQLSYDEAILIMQVTYRPYKRASNFRVSLGLELTRSTSRLDVQSKVTSQRGSAMQCFRCHVRHYSPISYRLSLDRSSAFHISD
jgi:hypothetical protein